VIGLTKQSHNMPYDSNKTIAGLEAITSIEDNDLIVAGDTSDTDRAKKITFANLKAEITGDDTAFVRKSEYDANSILYATTDNTPLALEVPTNSVVGRVAGNITTLAVDSDLSSVSANDDTVPSAKATKTALDLKAPSTAPTFATSITGSYLTASEVLITDADKKIVSAPVATYPSLTELSYVKGVTSSIQTQLNASSITNVMFPQVVNTNDGANNADTVGVASAIGSNSPIFSISLATGGTTLTIRRFVRDTSGQYYQSHSTTYTNGVENAGKASVIVLGDYVYVSGKDSSEGGWRVKRYAIADLTGETTMTISGTGVNSNASMDGSFTDGTDLYFYDNFVAGGARRKYSLSGTTLTFVSSITYTGNSSLPTYCDGTNVFGYDGDIVKHTLAGGAATSTSTRNLLRATPLNTATRAGIFYATSTLLYVVNAGSVDSNTAITHKASYFIPIAKP
jgi:hypothetical protein